MKHRRILLSLTILSVLPYVNRSAGNEVFTAGEGNPAYKALLYRPAVNATMSPKKALRLRPGPHLFIDDYLIDKTVKVTRRVNRPLREAEIANPIITGKEDLNYQPYMTVLRDPKSGRFRIWYNARREDYNPGRSHLAMMESDDGIHWRRPPRLLDDPAPIAYGASVIDSGPNCSDPAVRYKFGWWLREGGKDPGGLRIAVSPDGLDWNLLTPQAVLIHRDIMNMFFDSLRNRYVAIVCSARNAGPTWKGMRRLGMQSVSRDLIHWEKPWYVLTPDDGSDPAETQFYAMGGHLIRGELYLATVRILHDNLQAEGTPEGSYGVSHTQLAWSRDGETWVRDQAPFFEPNPTPGAWDHAHAWIGSQVPVGDEVYLYYCGYKNGHKVNRFEERQIGLVRMPRDRYVSRDAGEKGGTLITQPVILQGDRITVNACVNDEMRVRLLDVEGTPIHGFDTMIQGDGVALPVEWKQSLSTIKDKSVRIEFQMKKARLYAFDVEP